jgi:excisionase family DNA binding protein
VEALLNLQQAAEILGLAEVTVRKLVRNRKLTAVKIGRRLLFEPERLRRFIARNRTGLSYEQKVTDLKTILGLWQKHTSWREENNESISKEQLR